MQGPGTADLGEPGVLYTRVFFFFSFLSSRRESRTQLEVYHILHSLVKLSNGLRHRKEEVGSGDRL